MALLLCDLDDTLVDRGRVFGLWANDFVQAHGLTSEDRSWLADLDNGRITTREHFWDSIKRRVGLRQPVEVLVADWAVDFPSRYRCDDGVLDSLADARERGWSLGVVTNGEADIQARKLVAAGLDVAVTRSVSPGPRVSASPIGDCSPLLRRGLGRRWPQAG